MTSSSTAVVPWSPQQGGETLDGRQLQSAAVTKSGQGCGHCKGADSAKRKWLVVAGVALAIAAAVFGSIWFGFAAVLPLLYVLPCLAMLAMCMRGMKSTDSGELGGGELGGAGKPQPSVSLQ
jgi:hypothetical protein